MVSWLGFSTCTAVARVPSLVWEVRSHVKLLYTAAKTKRKNPKTEKENKLHLLLQPVHLRGRRRRTDGGGFARTAVLPREQDARGEERRENLGKDDDD